ncbi:phospholipase effector Tle1 domain-containing protein [Escherichia coli]|uniref:T6SS phospholipase effector Tle1-like catalytic domain-containing protein n=1 Tax=Escherichia coli TaxID=562 RepID=UPI003B974446
MSSEISGLAFPCYAPPVFPEDGRLILSEAQVNANYLKQINKTEEHKTNCSKQAGFRIGFTCSQSLHISLFFDGTNNNEYNDTKASHPTNIAKLFHTSIEDRNAGYFSYYMPGVGTPFPKIGEMDYSNSGLEFATGGEDRINWALSRLVDALSYAIDPAHNGLNDTVAKGHIPLMRAPWPMTGEVNRRNVINPYLEKLQGQLEQAKPRLLNVKLFIYGFSRGAAEARTFVNWLTQLACPQEQQVMLAGLAVSIEFLGLLDTVASVGAAHVLPGAAGHMGWADSTQQLPDERQFPGLIKCCRHFVAAHEQRLCFPLDSIRRPDGNYPLNAEEVIYPGMHSDVGGGYPVRDQGKSCGGSGEILSQIALHDMYLAAFDEGSPLSVHPLFITKMIKDISPSRAMSDSSIAEFAIAPMLIKRFNIWRQTLLNTTLQGTEEMNDTREGYHSYQLAQVLESAISDQIGWITAWRIGRYANNSLLVQPFYIKAPQLDKDGLDKEAKARKEQMENIEKERANKQKGNGTLDESNQGIPILDPTNAQYQLREAAREFQSDYKGWTRDINGSVTERAIQILVDVIPKYPVYLINGDDEAKEYQQIKAMGDGLYPQFFIDSLGTGTRTQPCAELLALYDDQVHDSRAWFMQSSLGGREPWGGYFRYRMIYCGDEANKELKLISADGKVVGDQPTSNRVIYWMESKTVSRG